MNAAHLAWKMMTWSSKEEYLIIIPVNISTKNYYFLHDLSLVQQKWFPEELKMLCHSWYLSVKTKYRKQSFQ